ACGRSARAIFCHTARVLLSTVRGWGDDLRVDPSQIENALALPARPKPRRLNASMRDRSVHVSSARRNTLRLSAVRRLFAVRTGYSVALALAIFICGSKALQNAIAEGDTRTITMHHLHTAEDISITYKRNGRYDEAALEKLNWFLRDWRRGEQTRIDPH